MQVYHCFRSKVTSNQLCHNKWFWKIHCVTFECQSNRDAWRESEMNTDETTLGQTSSYNFQVRAKAHRTISPLSFHSSGEAVPGESRGFRPQFSLFHPKRHSCHHPSSGWKMNTNSNVFLLSSLFWALLYFPEWLPWEIPKLVHDQGHCVDQWENIIWKCFLPNALFFLSGTQVSQDASKDLTQNGDAGTGYKSLFSASSSRWLFS